jgi:hypothetical protein
METHGIRFALKNGVAARPFRQDWIVMSDCSSIRLGVEETRPPLSEEDVVEIPLLLPGWQASVLEKVAHQRGLTAAVMVRHLLHDYLVGMPVRPGRVL